jgi:hypothetical protein
MSRPCNPIIDSEGPIEGHLTLCEVLDRVLNKGAVVCGDATISVANVDLIYISLRLLITAVETARRPLPETY